MKKTFWIIIGVSALLFSWILYRESSRFFGESSSVTAPSTETISYRSPSGLFTVDFPNPPEYKSEIVRDASGFADKTYETYAAEDSSKALYSIFFIRYLDTQGILPLPASTLLNNVMYEMLDKDPKSRLLGFKKLIFKNRPALRFSFEHRGLKTETLSLIDESDLYMISVTAPEASFPEGKADAFLSSFSINR